MLGEKSCRTSTPQHSIKIMMKHTYTYRETTDLHTYTHRDHNYTQIHTQTTDLYTHRDHSYTQIYTHRDHRPTHIHIHTQRHAQAHKISTHTHKHTGTYRDTHKHTGTHTHILRRRKEIFCSDEEFCDEGSDICRNGFGVERGSSLPLDSSVWSACSIHFVQKSHLSA